MGKTFFPSTTSAPASSSVIFAGLVIGSAAREVLGANPMTAAHDTITASCIRNAMFAAPCREVRKGDGVRLRSPERTLLTRTLKADPILPHALPLTGDFTYVCS